VKTWSDGSLENYKVHLVTCSSQQENGCDYDDLMIHLLFWFT
jgi:hypothetical protein